MCGNRRITNQAEVVAAVRTATEAEVVVFHFPEDAGLGPGADPGPLGADVLQRKFYLFF